MITPAAAPVAPSTPLMSDDYRVQLDAYHGPLDLLLFLVKRHEIDLHDIPIATLTEQYLQHLKLIEVIDVERVGEFLVMAATLLEIKSRMLMPPDMDPAEEGDDANPTSALETADPRYELVQQLLAYKRYKDAAMQLEDRQEEWSKRFAAHPVRGSKDTADDADAAEQRVVELEDADVMDLCQAFVRILDSIGNTAAHEVSYDDTPISLHAEDIYDRLKRDGAMTLRRIFVGRETRSEMVGLFLAVLELVRNRKITVVQETVGDEIALRPVPEDEQAVEPASDEAADWRDPETGEMQYDWPDPEAKARSEARAKRRAELMRKRLAGEEIDESEQEDVYEPDDDMYDLPDVGD